MLNEDGELILKNKENANTFHDYFGSIVENLNLDWDEDSNSYSKINHRNNQSIKNIKKKYKNIKKF